MPELPPADESAGRLRRAGWTIAEAVFAGPATETLWFVRGVNGENLIQAHGSTRDRALWMACEQAAAVGMLAR